MFLEISQIPLENTCARGSFLKTLQVSVCNFIKKETVAQVFSCKFCEISNNSFFTEHLRATASIRYSLVIISFFLKLSSLAKFFFVGLNIAWKLLSSFWSGHSVYYSSKLLTCNRLFYKKWVGVLSQCIFISKRIHKDSGYS